MKQLHYIGVQGHQASTFWFKNQDAHSFRSLVESLTMSRALLISSIYRTDLLYFSETDLSAILIKLWCILKSHHFDGQVKSGFIRTDNRKDTLEQYFESLRYLMQHPVHFHRYKSRFHELRELEPGNPILGELLQCDSHLATCYNKKQLPYLPLQPAESTNTSGQTLFGFQELAISRIVLTNFN